MQHPRPFVVFQSGKVVFTIHARSAEQARQLIDARLSDTTALVLCACKNGTPRRDDDRQD